MHRFNEDVTTCYQTTSTPGKGVCILLFRIAMAEVNVLPSVERAQYFSFTVARNSAMAYELMLQLQNRMPIIPDTTSM